jgi:hypothetical protein
LEKIEEKINLVECSNLEDQERFPNKDTKFGGEIGGGRGK